MKSEKCNSHIRNPTYEKCLEKNLENEIFVWNYRTVDERSIFTFSERTESVLGWRGKIRFLITNLIIPYHLTPAYWSPKLAKRHSSCVTYVRTGSHEFECMISTTIDTVANRLVIMVRGVWYSQNWSGCHKFDWLSGTGRNTDKHYSRKNTEQHQRGPRNSGRICK